MISLIIIGASGHGSVIADMAKDLGYSIFFWDDDISKKIPGYDVFKRELNNSINSRLIIGIGSNKTREAISLQYPQESFISLIHPQAIISNKTNIANGTVVLAGAIVNCGTTIEEHCILNTGAVVDHDCVLGKYVHISPNATLCGNVIIGSGTRIGAGSTVIQGIKIGENVTVGAGAVIINDIPNNATVVGNPGKIIKVESK